LIQKVLTVRLVILSRDKNEDLLEPTNSLPRVYKLSLFIISMHIQSFAERLQRKKGVFQVAQD
jgi:hypothetical protein